jgi:hypothetical protein
VSPGHGLVSCGPDSSHHRRHGPSSLTWPIIALRILGNRIGMTREGCPSATLASSVSELDHHWWSVEAVSRRQRQGTSGRVYPMCPGVVSFATTAVLERLGPSGFLFYPRTQLIAIPTAGETPDGSGRQRLQGRWQERWRRQKTRPRWPR